MVQSHCHLEGTMVSSLSIPHDSCFTLREKKETEVEEDKNQKIWIKWSALLLNFSFCWLTAYLENGIKC
jgi:hypothetical protein